MEWDGVESSFELHGFLSVASRGIKWQQWWTNLLNDFRQVLLQKCGDAVFTVCFLIFLDVLFCLQQLMIV